MLSDTEIKDIAVQLIEENSYAKGMQKFIYQGKSMNPILKEGDRLLVKELSSEDVHLGDAIVYKSKDRLIVHRFLYRKLKDQNLLYMVAKADNSSETDPPFNSQYFIGKVVEINRGRKRLKLESSLWQITSYLIGVVSLLEVLSFAFICFIKSKILKNLEIKRVSRQTVSKFIRMPKLLLTRILFLIIRN